MGAASGGASTSGTGGDGAASGGNGNELPADQDPGRVTLHRLNRVEYANTVRDLLGTTQRPSDDFPADDRGYGFDNIADVLSLSPLQLEMYFNAAQVLVDEAMNVTQVGARRFEAEQMTRPLAARTAQPGTSTRPAASRSRSRSRRQVSIGSRFAHGSKPAATHQRR